MDLKKELNTKSPQCQAGIWVINLVLKPFLCSHLKRERKLLFRPDQQYSRSARLVSCIGINIFHNQNIHFDKRKQIAEIWNYSYRNVVYTTNTFYPLFVDDNVYSVHCTVHPKILEIYTCMHAPLHIPCSLLADDGGIQNFKCLDLIVRGSKTQNIPWEREAKIADLSTFLSLVVVGSILVFKFKIQLSF